MEGTRYRTPAEVLRRAREAIGVPFGAMDRTGRLATGKGAIGTTVEEGWFGYSPNGRPEPDFPEAGVELKVAPYLRTPRGIRAKERLVCDLINYMTEPQKTFWTSDFWRKCQTLLLLSYEHREGVPKAELCIDQAALFQFPPEDLSIVARDWETIMGKIRAGQAHLLTEGDTHYLAACTKGASAATVRPQPFSPIPAKQRAYSLKSSYMTRILERYLFGAEESEHILTDPALLTAASFPEAVLQRLRPWYGWTQGQLAERFGLPLGGKDLSERLLARMLGVRGRVAATEEFRSAGILPKTVRLQRDGHLRESLSFPAFRPEELAAGTWETSQLRELLEPTRFLFVRYRETASGDYALEGARFWNMPAGDLEEVRRVWERTAETIRRGVRLWSDGRVTHNDLPKASESPVAHVRPHARNAQDVCRLPDGRTMPKQSFWLNRAYVERICQEGAG